MRNDERFLLVQAVILARYWTYCRTKETKKATSVQWISTRCRMGWHFLGSAVGRRTHPDGFDPSTWLGNTHPGWLGVGRARNMNANSYFDEYNQWRLSKTGTACMGSNGRSFDLPPSLPILSPRWYSTCYLGRPWLHGTTTTLVLADGFDSHPWGI
jgi:hypothetical protein